MSQQQWVYIVVLNNNTGIPRACDCECEVHEMKYRQRGAWKKRRLEFEWKVWIGRIWEGERLDSLIDWRVRGVPCASAWLRASSHCNLTRPACDGGRTSSWYLFLGQPQHGRSRSKSIGCNLTPNAPDVSCSPAWSLTSAIQMTTQAFHWAVIPFLCTSTSQLV
jgi:hypothetical protein